jgi:geranylgeranyl diphosphate synthase, type I
MSSELVPGMLEAIERELRRSLEALDAQREPELLRMVRYHFGWTEARGEAGGKRVRSLLALLTCSAAGGAWERALPGAVAVELIHNFSLLHDDIEDRSEYRRGRRAVWVEWGVPQAINTGDALFALSYLATYPLLESGLSPETYLAVRRSLDRACLELTRGQHMDIAFEGRESVTLDEYRQMIEGKTAALLSTATETGALIGGAASESLRAYRDFGLHLGLAFQVLDDLLGVWGIPEETGKTAGDDLRMRKKSFPIVIGLAESAEFRERWAQAARDEASVRAMARLLDQSGARSHTQAAAEDHTRRALEALAQAQPRPPAAAELESLTTRLLRRTA